MNDMDLLEASPVRAAAAAVLVPGSPEWHEQRRLGVGGSEVAAVLGLSDWMTAYELWLYKRGELHYTQKPTTEPQRWGHLLEPVVKQRYAEVTGLQVVDAAPMQRSELHPFMFANLDGMVYDGARPLYPLEVKTARTAEGWGEPESDEIPLGYLLQVQHYLYVTEYSRADVAALIGGSDFRVFHIHADAELQAMMLVAEENFWHMVEAGVEPPIVNLPDVKRRYAGLSAKGTVQATLEDLETLARLREVRGLIDELTAAKDESEARLMLKLADKGDTLVHPDTRKPLVTWKLAAAPMRFDVEAFGAAHPGILAKFTAPGKGSRRFLLK